MAELSVSEVVAQMAELVERLERSRSQAQDDEIARELCDLVFKRNDEHDEPEDEEVARAEELSRRFARLCVERGIDLDKHIVTRVEPPERS